MSIHKYFNEIAARSGFSRREIFALMGGQPTPAKLDMLSEVVEAVSGSYTREGLRRWFNRARAPLNGKSPGEVLKQAGWQPADSEPQEVLRLARSLLV